MEGVNAFSVWVEVPKYKKPWFRKAYYDEKELIWAIVGSDGNLIYARSSARPSSFPSMSAAREFIKKIQAAKKETVIEAAEAREVQLTPAKETSSGGAR